MNCLQEVLEATQKAMGSLHKWQVKRTQKVLHLSLTRGWTLTLSVDQKLNPAAFIWLHLQSRPWPWPPTMTSAHDPLWPWPLTMKLCPQPTWPSSLTMTPEWHMTSDWYMYDPRMIHYPRLIHDPWMTPETWLIHNLGMMRDLTDTIMTQEWHKIPVGIFHTWPLDHSILYVRWYIAPA